MIPGTLGLGGAPLGNFAAAMDDDRARRTLDRAWDRGIRYFDTAPHYGLGLSERRLGAALRERPRDEFVVSTKVGRLLVPRVPPREWDDDGFLVPGDLERRWDFSPEGVERSLRESLDRLGLDAVDILFAHDPDQAWGSAARESLASLARLKQAGLVSAIGIGTNSTAGLSTLIGEGLVDVIMLANRYSLLEASALETVLEPAREAGVAVVAVGVFATGLLSTARPAAGATFEYRPADAAVLDRTRRIAEICEDHGVELPVAALAFPLLHPAVAAVAVGMRSPGEVDENLERFAADVPDGLWRDLVAAGFLPAAAVPTRSPGGRPGDAAATS
ncbi:aldo/keto reductase [Cryptosporangium arvum]|uniref:Putative oxidoreductase, aryl-alcohol dehydrogenase like protein n=1 Tax=Cryptosporangium arvum DSM 44712 TaxID=927661 RepID=A0A010ZZI1_9ACTN|nr:aldo/keto reductase [Cryptosporangium arvum]EXG82632.1 putative oxidoreductase, aryl-alcohol dehydrogenase like protein [Cryptosporangium arvum DSM 44712]